MVPAAFASVLLVEGVASAESVKRDCAQSASEGQRLRDEGKPLAARAQFLACARSACPSIVRSRCGRWLEEMAAAIPSVVVRARAGSPEHLADVTDVTVVIDGAKVADSLDGQPIPLEPGGHTLQFTRSGAPPVEEHVLLVAGEKNRQLVVDFPGEARSAPPSSATAGSPVPITASAAPPRESASIRPGAWVFTGLTVAAAGSFAYFGLTGKSELDSLRATCAGHCDQGPVSSAWNKLIAADVSLGIGVLSAGLATWLFLSPHHAEPPSKYPSTAGFLAAPSARGMQLGWYGVF